MLGLGKWFLGEEDATKFEEVPFEVEKDEALLVFHNRQLPDHALNAEGLTRSWIESAEEQLAARKPTDEASLEQFHEEMGGAPPAFVSNCYARIDPPEPHRRERFHRPTLSDWRE